VTGAVGSHDRVAFAIAFGMTGGEWPPQTFAAKRGRRPFQEG